MQFNRLITHLKQKEGFRSKPYKDTTGHMTIGYGFNLDAGISPKLAEIIMEYQIQEFEVHLFRFEWFNRLDEERQQVILAMAYQLGVMNVIKFKKMIRSIESGDFEEASNQMLDSLWAKQTPARAIKMAEMMKTGVFE